MAQQGQKSAPEGAKIGPELGCTGQVPDDEWSVQQVEMWSGDRVTGGFTYLLQWETMGNGTL